MSIFLCALICSNAFFARLVHTCKYFRHHWTAVSCPALIAILLPVYEELNLSKLNTASTICLGLGYTDVSGISLNCE